MMPPTTDTQDDIPLFDGYESAAREIRPSEQPGLSADRRRTLRQAEHIAAGIHPLTRGPLHELASRHRDAASPKSDPFTCGSCWFREVIGHHNRSYPKCTFGLTNEMKYITASPRISASAATDVRAWWPACRDYSPSDHLSSDAARSIPEASA